MLYCGHCILGSHPYIGYALSMYFNSHKYLRILYPLHTNSWQGLYLGPGCLWLPQIPPTAIEQPKGDILKKYL